MRPNIANRTPPALESVSMTRIGGVEIFRQSRMGSDLGFVTMKRLRNCILGSRRKPLHRDMTEPGFGCGSSWTYVAFTHANQATPRPDIDNQSGLIARAMTCHAACGMSARHRENTGRK